MSTNGNLKRQESESGNTDDDVRDIPIPRDTPLPIPHPHRARSRNANFIQNALESLRLRKQKNDLEAADMEQQMIKSRPRQPSMSPASHLSSPMPADGAVPMAYLNKAHETLGKLGDILLEANENTTGISETMHRDFYILLDRLLGSEVGRSDALIGYLMTARGYRMIESSRLSDADKTLFDQRHAEFEERLKVVLGESDEGVTEEVEEEEVIE